MIHPFSEHAEKQNKANRVNLTSIYNGYNTSFQWIEMTERFINWNKQKLISWASKHRRFLPNLKNFFNCFASDC